MTNPQPSKALPSRDYQNGSNEYGILQEMARQGERHTPDTKAVMLALMMREDGEKDENALLEWKKGFITDWLEALNAPDNTE